MRNVSYQYDPVGNRQQVTDSGTGVSPVWYTANNLNQYTMVGGNNLSYDTKGNLQTVPGWTYQYDAQNRLLSASSVSSVVQFSYDARNRCVARTVNGTITRLVYDGWSLLEERNASGVEQARYYHGAMIDELLLRITANTHYYHHDGLGSTIALTDSTGALAESYTYDVFGAATIMATNAQLFAVSSVGNRFLFTGREYLAEIGLYDYRNRFYSQSLGRFLQTDPIGLVTGDVNFYRYVTGNPVGSLDPSGLFGNPVIGPNGRQWPSSPYEPWSPRPQPSNPYPVTWDFGENGRYPWDGPRQGEWMGGNWSGGLNPNQNGGMDGSKAPISSADKCAMEHDKCYESCEGKSTDRPKVCHNRMADPTTTTSLSTESYSYQPSEKDKCIKDCDSKLVDCLRKLDNDPRKWPQPPPVGSEWSSRCMRQGAIWWFK
jgi:RHS repeat-associated protein